MASVGDGEADSAIWCDWVGEELSLSATQAPAHAPIDTESIFPSDRFVIWDQLLRYPWNAKLGTGSVHTAERRRDDKSGLWLCKDGREPEFLVSGWFSQPVITPDEKWIVASRPDSGKSWAEPNSVYRINLK